MAANTSPIFSRAGDLQWGSVVTTANTAKDGTGTVVTVWTADPTNGGKPGRIRFRALGTNVATVARVFINNGSTNATASNNTLWDEITLPATTLSEVAAQANQEIIFPAEMVLPAGYKINITLGTTVSAGYAPTVIGGKY